MFHHVWVEVAPYWNVNKCYRIAENNKIEVEVAPYWNVNVGATQG